MWTNPQKLVQTWGRWIYIMWNHPVFTTRLQNPESDHFGSLRIWSDSQRERDGLENLRQKVSDGEPRRAAGIQWWNGELWRKAGLSLCGPQLNVFGKNDPLISSFVTRRSNMHTRTHQQTKHSRLHWFDCTTIANNKGCHRQHGNKKTNCPIVQSSFGIR